MSPFDDKEVEKDVFERLKEKTIELYSEGYIEIPAPETSNFPVMEISEEFTQIKKRIENIKLKIDELIIKKNNEREEIRQEIVDISHSIAKEFTNSQVTEINNSLYGIVFKNKLRLIS